MIQRIQTVYLTLAFFALAIFAAVGFAIDPSAVLLDDWHQWMTAAARLFAGLGGIAALIAIFRYADRTAQRDLIANAQWLVIVALVLEVVVIWLFPTLVAFTERGMSAVPVLLPLVGYALLMLARKAIDRDIALVKSMDRLR